MSVLTAFELAKALVAEGVFTQDEINQVTRIVIDADANTGTVVMHIERIGDKRLLDIAALLTRAKVVRELDPLPSATTPPQEHT